MEERVVIYHMHVKDAIVTLRGRTGILASHINFGDYRRGWDFRSPGRGTVNFEEIIRALNQVNYQGPLSVEWEDSGMEREFHAHKLQVLEKHNLSATPSATTSLAKATSSTSDTGQSFRRRLPGETASPALSTGKRGQITPFLRLRSWASVSSTASSARTSSTYLMRSRQTLIRISQTEACAAMT
jgi:hypothetical protein